MSGGDGISARWEELGQMDRAALRVAWAEVFGDAPPHFLSMIFMRKALILSAQSRKYGGLKPDVKRDLKAAAEGRTVRAPATRISAGTQLVREWNGQRYIVEVTEDGFRMNGEHFRSLSAVARHVTGTSWSGPRFFRLTSWGQRGT